MMMYLFQHREHGDTEITEKRNQGLPLCPPCLRVLCVESGLEILP